MKTLSENWGGFITLAISFQPRTSFQILQCKSASHLGLRPLWRGEFEGRETSGQAVWCCSCWESWAIAATHPLCTASKPWQLSHLDVRDTIVRQRHTLIEHSRSLVFGIWNCPFNFLLHNLVRTPYSGWFIHAFRKQNLVIRDNYWDVNGVKLVFRSSAIAVELYVDQV